MADDKLLEQEEQTGRTYRGNEMVYLREVLESGRLSSLNGGAFVPRFEEAFAELLGAEYAVAINTCMSALHAGVLCAGAGPGSEVICDSEFIFGSMAVLYNNAIPVYVDLDPVTHNMNPDGIEAAITERTKAIIVTHAWGLPAEMDRIVEIGHRRGLLVIEDCAESLLADYKVRYTGAWGDIGCFSFQASKQLSLGDGGMATANSEALQTKIASQAGAPTFKSVAYDLDFNYRMNEPTAAVGLAQLEVMPAFIQRLRANARHYDDAVAGCPWIVLQRGPEGSNHSFYHWAATFQGGDGDLAEFRKVIESAGFDSVSVGYTGKPAYKHPVIEERRAHAFHCPENAGHSGRYDEGTCPFAERIIPRLLLAYVVESEESAKREAEKLNAVIREFGGS
ncbi:MAG: DegT/DnrJ/EryC1/StrS family aminotransferase [Armatimonadetes bacterium]|nr:DegT/DnrJ/EryC1/StrS family aminotransferase [Armatimonadota bacterium]